MFNFAVLSMQVYTISASSVPELCAVMITDNKIYCGYNYNYFFH